jgi:hypothetical protein
VLEVIYAGDATRYRVGLGGDTTLTVKIPNRLGGPAYAPGDAVRLAWHPGETRLFPRDTDEA